MQALSVSIDPDGMLRVTLRGELDFTNAAGITDAIRAVTEQERPTAVRMDLAEVTFLDSSGIGLLVAAMRAAEEARATFGVEHPNPKVYDQLRTTGLLAPFGLAEPAAEG